MEKLRDDVFVSILKGYKKILEAEVTGIGRVTRPGKTTTLKCLCEKGSWYKQKEKMIEESLVEEEGKRSREKELVRRWMTPYL